MIYIIADDLTGANDTGVQFAKQGYNTQVVIVSEIDSRSLLNPGSLAKETDILVLDTETRDVDAVTARKRIKQVLENLNPDHQDIVYKKIDSTLRGNIGAELDECMNMLQKDICIFTPSFPLNKRITVGGYLIVENQPVGLSEYYNGDLEPGEASYVPALLAQHTNFLIARIDLGDVIKGRNIILGKLQELYAAGNRIIVLDAITEEQLQNILITSSEFEGSVLYSGSAGLANALSEIYQGTKHTQVIGKTRQEPVLVVSGSRRSINQRQIEYLKKNMNVFDVIIDVEQIFANRKQMLDRYEIDLTQALRQGRHTVIHPDPRYHDQNISQNLLVKHKLSLRDLELTIRDFLGKLIIHLIENSPVRNLILTGGDTAIGVCSALQIYNLNIVNELLPGIPLSVGRFKDNIDLNIITKAGGFGEENTFHTLIEKIMPYQHNSHPYHETDEKSSSVKERG